MRALSFDHAAKIATALCFALLVTACASPPTPGAMRAATPVVASAKKAPGGVVVTTAGGTETSNLAGVGISDEDLKSAIEASLADAAIFNHAGQDPARYLLQASIVQLSKPSFGASFTVDLEIAWTLTDKQLGTRLLRKSIQSSHTATMSEALVGANRIRLAIEGAARKNIESAMMELSRLNY
jgi:hypothetical protein